MIWSFKTFLKLLCWILTVNNPQPKVRWCLRGNLVILILKAKLFKILCNISMISFIDVKTFKLESMLTIISIHVHTREIFSDPYSIIFYARHKENASIHWKYFLSLKATCYTTLFIKHQTLQRINIIFSLLTLTEHVGSLETLLPKVPPYNQSVSFTPNLMLRILLLLIKELFLSSQCSNLKMSIDVTYCIYILYRTYDRKSEKMK